VLLRDRAARYAGLPGREAAAQRRCLERGLAHLDQRLAVTAQQIDVLEAPPRTRALTH
jgi:hypothetical protein